MLADGASRYRPDPLQALAAADTRKSGAEKSAVAKRTRKPERKK
jgi:hypothetical protein